MSASSSSDKEDTKTSGWFHNQTGSRFDKDGMKKFPSLRYTLWLGIIAGLTFSLALWGYESILFIKAHIAYPWLPVLTGTLLCILFCTLAALFTWLVNRALLGVIFWILAARLIALLATFLPLKIAPALMKFFEPGLNSRLPAYPISGTFQTWAWIGTIWLAIFMGILGLLQLTLVESSVPATTAGGRLGAYIIFVPVMILASVLSSNMVNEQMRAPLIATDELIQFAVDNQNTNVDPAVARQMHLSSVKNITNLINRPHRLFLGKYDEYYSQVGVLIDFEGEWVECSTVSAQPVFCNPLSEP